MTSPTRERNTGNQMRIGRYLNAVICACVLALSAFSQSAPRPNVTVSFELEDRPYSQARNAAIEAAPSLTFFSQLFLNEVLQRPIPDNGVAQLSLAPGTYVVSGVYDGIMGGSSEFTVIGSEPVDLTVRMTGEGILGILTVNVTFNGDARPIPSAEVNQINISFLDDAGQPYTLADDWFDVTAYRVQNAPNMYKNTKTIGSNAELSPLFSINQAGELTSPAPATLINALLAIGAGPYVLEFVVVDEATQLPRWDNIIIRVEK